MSSKSKRASSGEAEDGACPAKVSKASPLEPVFYKTPAENLAQDLLGKLLIRIMEDGTRVAGYIVDTEAFPGGEDQASHSHDGKRTGHNAALYEDPGTVYIHNTFGGNGTMYITSKGEGASVMIRALEPKEGLHKMRELRGKKKEDGGQSLLDTDLCSGPAKLTQSLAITRATANKENLAACDHLFIEEGRKVDKADIVIGHRIGMESHGKWAEMQWRYHIKGNLFVSVVDNEDKKAGNHTAKQKKSESPSPMEIDWDNIKAKHRLSTKFYGQPTEDLAQALLGKILTRELEDGVLLRGRIVETEAYTGVDDEASHSYGGKRTGHNAAMFLDPGTMYIHNTFGGNTSLYISSKDEGGAVLLRAVEPIDGKSVMRQVRGKKKGDGGESLEDTDLCSGTAKLTQAFQVSRADFNKQDLRACDFMWVEEDSEKSADFQVGTSPRILTNATGEHAKEPWRYFIKGSKHLSVQETEAKPKAPQKKDSTVHKPCTPVEVNVDKIKAKHRLSTEFFSQSVHDLSKALLGKVLVREEDDGTLLKCVVVETEAFPGGDDPASHSHDGARTGHNAALFLEPGTIYIHNTFGGNTSMYIVSKDSAVVKVRALEPRSGQELGQWMRSTGNKEDLVKGKTPSTPPSSSDRWCSCCRLNSRESTATQCRALELQTSAVMWVEEDEDLIKKSNTGTPVVDEILDTIKSPYFSKKEESNSSDATTSLTLNKSRTVSDKCEAAAEHSTALDRKSKTFHGKDVASRSQSAHKNVKRVPASFYEQSVHELSRALLGRLLVSQTEDGKRLSGVIVETESYPGGEDKASHSAAGKRTPRNEPMYMDPGTAYVYLIYGNLTCMNISSQGEGAAVLLRALEPREGKDRMVANRSKKIKSGSTKEIKDTDLCSGPAKLTQSLEIKRDKVNKQDLRVCDFLWIEEGDGPVKDADVVACHRIGIQSHGEWAKKPWRYYVRGNSHVSTIDKAAEKASQ